jgi:hypothetical protein
VPAAPPWALPAFKLPGPLPGPTLDVPTSYRHASLSLHPSSPSAYPFILTIHVPLLHGHTRNFAGRSPSFLERSRPPSFFPSLFHSRFLPVRILYTDYGREPGSLFGSASRPGSVVIKLDFLIHCSSPNASLLPNTPRRLDSSTSSPTSRASLLPDLDRRRILSRLRPSTRTTPGYYSLETARHGKLEPEFPKDRTLFG